MYIKRARLFIFLIAGVFLHLGSIAQSPAVSVSVTRNRIFLGEQFVLTIKAVTGPNDRPVVFPKLPDTLNHLELVRKNGIDSVRTGERLIYTQEITMTGFDSGSWVIPRQVITIKGKAFRTDSIRVSVLSLPLKGNDYNDIKEIKDVDDVGMDWKKWLLIVFVTGLILAGAYYWWKRRGVKAVSVPPVSRSTAYEEAMEALKKIRQEKANEKGEIKTYYSALYDVYRLYLSRISGKPLMQSTTDEIMISTKELLPADLFSSTAEVMRITDAVKFAKYNSELAESNVSFERIKMGIEEINRKKRIA